MDGNTRTISNEFEYLEPETIKEAISYLENYDNAEVMAGGTDLLIAMKRDEVQPDYVINLRTVEELSQIKEEESDLVIGPTSTFKEINASDKVRKHFDVLSIAASEVGGVQVRNMGTIGGNLSTASPVSSTGSPLLTLEAEVKLEGPNHERILKLEDFFTGPKQSKLKPNELLTEIRVPYSDHTGFSYEEIKRVSEDLGKITVAVLMKRNDDKIEYCKIGLGAVAPTPIRAREAENLLEGSAYSEELLNKVESKISEEISPIDDVRSTAEYREQVTGQVVKDGIKTAWEESE